jgi:serine/threonine protein kinase, bacterial
MQALNNSDHPKITIMKKIIYSLAGVALLSSSAFILQSFKYNNELISPSAETYMVTTLAGDGKDFSRDGKGDKAAFTSMLGHMTTDAAGNIYVIDGSRICKITPDGEVTTLFGQNIYDADNNPKEIGQWLNGADGICIDKNNDLYISQQNRHMIIKITGEKTITDYAGDDGHSGSDDGPALSSGLNSPKGMCIDKAGNIYVADSYNGKIRKISADGKTMTTVAGKGRGDYVPGTAAKSASFIDLMTVAVDSKGNVYTPQSYGRGVCIVKITPAGATSMFAGDIDKLGTGKDGTGKAAEFRQITAITTDAQDNIYVAESRRIRKITPAGVVTTIAGASKDGDSVGGFRDGEGSKAMFSYMNGIAVDAKGNIYTSDFETYRIRKIVKQ